MPLLAGFWNWFRPRKVKEWDRRLPLNDIKKKAKILIIDDDPNSFPSERLRDEGYTIEVWEQVKSISRLEDGEFDLIILDYAGVADESLSGDDGLAVLEHIKKVNPSQLIVAFSAKAFDAQKSNFWKLADDVMGKPVDAIKCKEVIDALLIDKFNIGYYWESITAVLRKEGVSEKEIAKIQSKVINAIDSGDSSNVLAYISEAAARLETPAKLVIGIAKIIGIAKSVT